MSEFEFPKQDQHTAVIGRNGSGKTQLGAWLLSESDLEQRPHVIMDFKRDELVNAIPHLKELKHDEVPKEPGVYISHFMPNQEAEMNQLLWNMWARENVHLHVDEVYMIGRDNEAFNAIMMQGRSKRVTVTALSQRPTMCSRYIFSEASHYSVFHMNDKRDVKTIEGFCPIDFEEILPEYHSHWYDVKRNKKFKLTPVPDAANILGRFDERLKPKRRFIQRI